MTRPIRPDLLPEWCIEPVKETVVYVDPSTGKQHTTKQINIMQPNPTIRKAGFVQDSAVVQQDLNWLFYTTYAWLKYFDELTNKPASYLKNELPPAADSQGLFAFVSDVSGGTIAFSNGTTWKKLTIGGDI